MTEPFITKSCPKRSHRSRFVRIASAALVACLYLSSTSSVAHADRPDLRPLRLDSVAPQPISPSPSSESTEPTDLLGRPMLWRPQPRVLDTQGSARASVTQPTPVTMRPSVAIRPAKPTLSVGNQTLLRPAGAENTDDRLVVFPASDALTGQGFRPNSAPEQPRAARTENAISPTSVDEALNRPGTITFRKTPLQEVVFLLSDLWQINIVAGEAVAGDVSGTFHETPLREVLSAILSASGYGYRKTGNSLIILPIDQIGGDNPQFVSRTLTLPASDDESTLVEAARMLLSERGQILPLGNNQILIKDHTDKVDEVQQLLASITGQEQSDGSAPMATGNPGDESLATRIDDALYEDNAQVTTRDGIAYFTLQYTEAEQMEEALQTTLGADTTIAVFAEENRIMVRGSTAQLRLATEAIRQLDVPRKQVRITALIYDVSLREVERLGINWTVAPHSSAITNVLNSEDLIFRNTVSGTTNFITDTAATGGANLALRTLNNRADIGALLQALDNSSESKLLADPSITVGDRREASIRIVQKIPIIAADPVESSGVVFSQVQFEEAGVILSVTPRIGRDDTIEMQVQPEYSVVTDFINNNPVIDSRTADTTVRIGNGHMFVLGGLRQKNVTETIRGVPFLKDVKYIGKMFRSHDTEVRESELIVFLKPEMVTPYYTGSAREQMAACVTSKQLDMIPYATTQPQTCCCKDPNCPNHHPRRRVNGGSAELEMLGGYGINNEVIIADEPVLDVNASSSVSPTTITHPAESFEPVHVEVIVP